MPHVDDFVWKQLYFCLLRVKSVRGGDAQVLLNVEYIQIRGKVLIQSSIKKR